MAAQSDVSGMEYVKENMSKGTSFNLQVECVQKLPLIALAIGPDLTRKELLPFIAEFLKVEEAPTAPIEHGDELLQHTATALGKFDELVGGGKHVHELLPALFRLATIDETLVRESAVSSINKLSRSMPAEHIVQYMGPAFVRLFDDDHWPSMVSACGLVAAAYEGSCAASSNVTAKIRASQVDGEPEWNKEELLQNFVSYFVRCVQSGEPMESIRAMALRSSGAIFKLCGSSSDLLPEVTSKYEDALSDSSWRVRFAVSESIVAVAEAMIRDDDTLRKVREMYVALLCDDENEVLMETLKKAAEAAGVFQDDSLTFSIFDKLEALVFDENDADNKQDNKRAAAKCLMKMAVPLSEDQAMERFLGGDESTSVMSKLLEDPNVQLEIIGQLADFVKSVPALQDDLFCKQIGELLDSLNWRVRHATMLLLPDMCKPNQSPPIDTFKAFENHFVERLKTKFTDNTWAIRRDAVATCFQLCQLAEPAGWRSGWLDVHVVPALRSLGASQSFQEKITFLTAFSQLSECLSPEVKDEFAQLAMKMGEDKVPNVKLAAAPILGLIAEAHPSHAKKCLELLQTLAEHDPDKDVREFADKARQGQ